MRPRGWEWGRRRAKSLISQRLPTGVCSQHALPPQCLPCYYLCSQSGNEPGECYNKEKPAEGKPKPPSVCAKFTTPKTCPADRCEWGQNAGESKGECWELEATTTATADGAQGGGGKDKRRLADKPLPVGFKRVGDDEVAGALGALRGAAAERRRPGAARKSRLRTRTAPPP